MKNDKDDWIHGNSANFISWTVTNELRYKKQLVIGGFENRLQQKWQGSDGSTQWKFVEYIDE